MATTATTPNESNLSLEPQAQNGSSEGLTTEKATVRAYWKLFPVKDSKTGEQKKDEQGSPVFELKIQAKAESADKSNWKKLEDTGWTLLNENEIVRYTCKTEEAIKALISEESQRVYLTQSGINYVSNSKANAFAVEIKEGTGTSPENPPVAIHNGEEYDLKAPLNEKPGRRALSQMEKLDKMLEAMGLSKEARVEFLRNAAASYEAAKASGAVPADSEEDEEGEEEAVTA